MMNFKKKAVIIFLVCLIFVPVGAWAEDARMWTILYDQAKTLQAKRDKTKMIAEVATPEFSALVINILKEAAIHNVDNNALTQKLYEDWVYYICMTAGRLNIYEAAPLIKMLYDRITNTVYKGELVNSLGKTGNIEYLPWMNEVLKKINTKHRVAQAHKVEPLVYGVVLGLTYFHDKSSFTELFYASLPFYSNMVQEAAILALEKITDDPAPLCTSILKNELDFKILLAAFRYAMASNSPDKHKVDVAIAALAEGVDRIVHHNQQVQQDQRVLRDEATFYLGELKSQSLITMELIEKKREMDNDVISTLIAIESLTKIGSHDAATLLTKWLRYYNEKKASGFGTAYRLKIDGDKILLAIIKAVGQLGNEMALDELKIISYSSVYESSFRRAADSARKAILKKSGAK